MQPKSIKRFLWALVALYWFWPVDLMPGLPFDDLAVVWAAWQYQDEITGMVGRLIQERLAK